MNKRGLFAFLLSIIMLLSLLTGCGDEPAVSNTDVSGGDISGGDVSAADLSEEDEVSATDWRELLVTEDELAVAQVSVSSTDAFNAEDIDAYMALIDPASSAYDSTREQTVWLFETYHLNSVIDDLRIDSLSQDKAVVTVTQTTRRVNGEDKAFTPRRAELEHTLVKLNGGWLFSSTIVRSSVELIDPWSDFAAFVADPSAFVPVSGSDAPADEQGEVEG